MTGQAISQVGANIYFTSTQQPQWLSVTFTGSNEPYGLLVYDTSVTNVGICFNYFGQQTVNGGTFTVVWPTVNAVPNVIASWAT